MKMQLLDAGAGFCERAKRSASSIVVAWALLVTAYQLPAVGASAVNDTTRIASDALPAVRLDGNYFVSGQKHFLVVGAHWVPAKTGLQWPLQWQPKDIEADFAKMAQMGFNTVRLDLFWAWFEPRPGDYSEAAFRQLDFLISMAHRYRIYLHPTLFVGGEVGEAYWDVPWRHGRNPQSDPLMLRLETNLAREFGRRYARETAILAWDLTDEPPFWISTGTDDSMAVNWTRLIAQGIRKYDSLHPIVVGVSTQDLDHGPFRPDTIVEEVDFLSVHPYTIYTPTLFPDPMVSERGTYGAAFETTLSRDAGRPVMVQELGASSAQYSTEKITQFERVSMYSALGAGANGFLLWCFTDAAPEQFHKVPYLRSAHETQFGLTSWDGKTSPQGAAFEEFIKTVRRVHFDNLSQPQADIGIVIPEEWARTRGDFTHFGLTGPEIIPYVSVSEGEAVNGQSPLPYDGNQAVMSSALAAFVLAHRAGMHPAFPRELSDWSKFPMIFLPSPDTATDPVFVHLHTDFWERARAYVASGGVLYASLAANSAIPEMQTLFGVRMTDSIPTTELTLTVVEPFGDLKAGDSFHFTAPSANAKHWGTGLEMAGAEVIAVDQNQRPAIVSNNVGRGKTLLSAYPLEAYLGNQPMAFENGDSAYRLIRALRDASGARSLVSTDQPSVEASALLGRDGGYIILANHSAAAQSTQITTTLPVKALSALGTDGSKNLVQTQAGWSIDVPGYAGVILEWRK
jgi:endo-1,4-beta-mannosidase